jgi:xanthine dehydrogenase accessory factor
MGQNIYEAIVEAGHKEERVALATIVSRQGSTPRKDAAKMLVFEDGRQIGTIGGGCSEAEVARAALLAIRTGKPQMLHFDLSEDDLEDSGLICGGSMEVYVEPILPQPTLYILGAGHVGRCLADLARPLGFTLAVVDDRVKYANRDRFPQADAVFAGAWEEVLAQLPVKSSSFLVIVTRGHAYDLVCLRFALRSPAGYIGMMGSRRKISIFFEKLRSEGIPPAEFARVYAPVGIEIGSETPEEIAVSIAAELIAVRKGLPARSLKELSAPEAAQT